jgi:hypothetical protein
MGRFEISNTLNLLAAGRRPLWSEEKRLDDDGVTWLDDYANIPDGESMGVAMGDVLRCAVRVGLRERASRRQATLTIPTFDAASTYTVTVDGTAHVNVTPATRNEALTELATAINAGAAASAVTAYTYDDDGEVSDTAATSLVILSDAELGFTLDFTSSGGSPVIAAVADPDSATVEIWACWAGTAASGSQNSAPAALWALVNGQTYAIDERGFIERFEVSGIDRLYVRVTDMDHTGDGTMVTYAATVHLGPCQTE